MIDVEPELKRRLYAALSLSGKTMKEWFTKEADAFCQEAVQPSLFRDRYEIESSPSTVVLPTGPRFDTSPPVKKTAANRLMAKKLRVISMFSGCGGMDLGFKGGFEVFGRRYKSLPFETVWANDINPTACKTFKRNLGAEIQCGNVWDLIDSMPKQVDVIIGGFPCQDISVNGKRVGVNGARSGLYKAMVEAIRKLHPKVFVAENVKGLLKNEAWLNQVLGDFNSLGYNVSYQLYKIADYGVPQTRERIIFVGTSHDVKPFVPPQSERTIATWMTAKEAVNDLEKLERSEKINHIWSLANTSPEQGNRILIPDRPAYTIRAECHGNIQYHYKLPRRISMREAARFQSFPDKFIFEGGIRETERQVGNAVPPVFAWHVANAVLACFQ